MPFALMRPYCPDEALAHPVCRARSEGAGHARRLRARAVGGRRAWRGWATRCTSRRSRAAPWPDGAVAWHAMGPPLGRPELRWTRRPAVTRLAREMRRRRHHRALLQLRRRGRAGRQRARRAGGARSQRADHRLPRLGQGAARSRAARRADAPLARPDLPARRTCSSRRRRRSCRRGSIAARCSRSNGAPTSITSAPTRPATRRSRAIRIACSCVFAGAFRSWHGVVHLSAALARLHAAGDHRFGARLHRRRTRARGRRARGARRARRHVHRRDSAHAAAGCARAADIGVAPFDPTRHAPAAARLLLVAAQDLRIHGGRAAGRRAGAAAAARGSSSTGARDCSTIPRIRAALDRALVALADPAAAPSDWGRPRARASCATSAGPRTAGRSTRGCARWSRR